MSIGNVLGTTNQASECEANARYAAKSAAIKSGNLEVEFKSGAFARIPVELVGLTGIRDSDVELSPTGTGACFLETNFDLSVKELLGQAFGFSQPRESKFDNAALLQEIQSAAESSNEHTTRHGLPLSGFSPEDFKDE